MRHCTAVIPVISLLLVGSLLGCGAHGGKTTPRTLPAETAATSPDKPVERVTMEPFKLQPVEGSEGPELELLDAADLFDRAGQHLSAKRYRRALALYDRLLKHFPDSSLAFSTLYNAGLCHEWLGEFERAVGRYKVLIQRFGSRKEAVDAGFRLGGCYAELRNWPASAQVFEAMLSRTDLSPADRIEAMTRKGLAHFRMDDHRMCRSTLLAALRYHRNLPATEQLDADFFVGMANYYLAAMPHVTFRKLPVTAGKKMAKELDEKARFLLSSQAAYINTIKTKNPYWATAAGFQIGSLYREFYTLLLTTLPDFDKQAKDNARKARIDEQKARKQLVQVYMEEVHKAVKPLLSKAIRVFERNVLVAERVGIESNWVARSRTQVNELKHLLSLPPEQAIKLVNADVVPEDQPALDLRDPALTDDDAPPPAESGAEPVSPPRPPGAPEPPGQLVM